LGEVEVTVARKRRSSVSVPATDVNGDDQIYVRIPLAPHVVTALREHAANGARLLELVTGSETAVADVFEHIAKTAAALERDLGRVRMRGRHR
jgi:hypothetical protein